MRKTNDLLPALEKGIRDVLSNEKSTPSEKIQAINAGSKLLQIKHKISGVETPEEENFFGGKNAGK